MRGAVSKAAAGLAAAAVIAMLPGGARLAAAQAVDPKLEEAVRWYTGMGGTVDDRRARELLLEAVEDGDPISRMWLARCYSRGRMFFERDGARAHEMAAQVIDEVRALALSDVAEAAFLMATAYDEGIGLSEDAAMAAAWYHRAADLGNVLAMHNLGNVFVAGRGVPGDAAMAFYWFRRAAEQGDAIPQWQLGVMLERGEGVERDLEAAIDWYRRAAARGNRQAREALDRLGEGSG